MKIILNVEEIDKQIEKLNKIKDIVIRSQNYELDDINTKIFKLYVITTSVTEVANILNEKGERLSSSLGVRKFQSNDVSKIIKNETVSDKELEKLVKSLFNKSSNFINAVFNWAPHSGAFLHPFLRRSGNEPTKKSIPFKR